jgi:hypothetical protein
MNISFNLSFSGTMNQLLLSHWSAFTSRVQGKASKDVVSGSNLHLATVVAVAKYVRPQHHG